VVKGRSVIHIPPTDLIPSKADGVSKPLPGHPDGHLQAEPDLGMEKGRGVLVISEILDELGVLLRELVNVFAQTDSGCIHNRQVRPKGLQELRRARFKGRHCIRHERPP
jgi:hypothetical protein